MIQVKDLKNQNPMLILLSAAVVFLCGFALMYSPGATIPYEGGWEARTRIGAVRIHGESEYIYPGKSPWSYESQGLGQVGDMGYAQMTFDPDQKKYSGYPNVEVQVGDIKSGGFWGVVDDWSKRLLDEKTIPIEIAGKNVTRHYVWEEYRFDVRIAVKGDVRGIEEVYLAHDDYETETSYDRSGKTISGEKVSLTVYPAFIISPWSSRYVDGVPSENLWAGIMSAKLINVETFADEVEQDYGEYKHHYYGTCLPLTSVGVRNMYTEIEGAKLPQVTWNPEAPAHTDAPSSIIMSVEAQMLPGWWCSTDWANIAKDSLHQVPRDMIFTIAVEVVRSEDFEIEVTRIKDDLDQSGGDEGEGETDGWDPITWFQKLPFKHQVILGMVGGILLLALVVPMLQGGGGGAAPPVNIVYSNMPSDPRKK